MAKLPFEKHNFYKETTLSHRRFKHRDIVPLLEELKHNSLFEVEVIGKSVEKRDIYMVKAGTGKTKVMLWSQMHGDEATATMALFDLFNFLRQSDEMDSVRQEILNNTTLYIIPMLNPDGAERFIRRNALHIDLNRDAILLQSPEAVLLKSMRDKIEPEFGFNLHDQSRYYTVGNTSKTATISFLAPPFDHAKTVNTVRARAMRTIVGMNEALQQLIPGHIAKYSDDYEPRAFGDNIQKWGTSVILIESGGYTGDPEKQVIRQLNFASIVSALHLIATDGYKKYALEDYYTIPENTRNLFDLVIRKVQYQQNGHTTLLDLGIMREEVELAAAPQGFYYRSNIEELGDMSVFYGYEELNGEGLTLLPGKVYPEAFQSIAQLTKEVAHKLLAQGYTTVQVEEQLSTDFIPQQLLLNITRNATALNHDIVLEGSANFILKDPSGRVKYAVVNGFIRDLKQDVPLLFHGLVL
ncbi:M14 family zinc carboxypeptidase [Pontibacter cellulosilyticus]|uniref:Peptidase M14 n=1 Tax=Pontibacter cellulosilyticus TaxID=1720253 RepID=A0A923SI52_9BACT|nr:M14 family zinc carboxypeptidase [Pontibacter cellulosilyticus]MBC5992242.1 peptidase M14 [Pontibacter cellulosilyticus]